jgi:hypothetical protein
MGDTSGSTFRRVVGSCGLDLAMRSVRLHGIHAGTGRRVGPGCRVTSGRCRDQSAGRASPGRDDEEGGEVESAGVDVGEVRARCLHGSARLQDPVCQFLAVAGRVAASPTRRRELPRPSWACSVRRPRVPTPGRGRRGRGRRGAGRRLPPTSRRFASDVVWGDSRIRDPVVLSSSRGGAHPHGEGRSPERPALSDEVSASASAGRSGRETGTWCPARCPAWRPRRTCSRTAS